MRDHNLVMAGCAGARALPEKCEAVFR